MKNGGSSSAASAGGSLAITERQKPSCVAALFQMLAKRKLFSSSSNKTKLLAPGETAEKLHYFDSLRILIFFIDSSVPFQHAHRSCRLGAGDHQAAGRRRRRPRRDLSWYAIPFMFPFSSYFGSE
jgi:hypothetical protein